jgi:CRISPR-associated protein Cmr1
MKSVTFTCEVVTPMFLAGADGSTPELREPSIKGALRFWWRALHGCLPIDDIENPNCAVQKGLRTQEAEIFGRGGDKARRSCLIIKTTHPEWDKNFRAELLPHKKQGSTKAFNPKTPQSFQVNLSLTRLFEDFDINRLEALFVLTFALGGFGKRSRRGFGSVRIVKKNDVMFQMPCDLSAILEYVLKFNRDYRYDSQNDRILLVKPDLLNGKYQKVYPYIEEIRIGNDYNSGFELVERIGESSHAYQTNLNGCPSPRFASPTYVSTLKDKTDKTQYYPVITSLCLALPPGINDSEDERNNMNDFRNAILDKRLPLY